MGKKNDGALQRFVAQIPSVLGSMLGTSVAAQTGDAIAGAAVGQVFTSVGEDFVSRVLSPREEARIETTMRLALARLNRALEDDGAELRTDGLFEPGAEGDEIFEGVLNAARNAYEERKIPYIANVFVWVAVSPHIDARTAHAVITEAEAISWAQMCLLALVAEPEKWGTEEDFDVTTIRPATWTEWTVQNLFERMDSVYFYSPHFPAKSTPNMGLALMPEPDNRLKSLKLNNRGTLLMTAMGLSEIPDAELVDISTQIVAARRASPDEA